MRTSSIFVCLLSSIALISFQDRCQSEPAKTQNKKESKPEEIEKIKLKISDLGQKDPKAAILFALEKQKEGISDDVFPKAIASKLFNENPIQCLEWASTLSDGDFDKVIQFDENGFKEGDLEKIDVWMRNEMPRGKKRESLMFAVGSSKAFISPTLAAKWAESLPLDDPDRVDAVDAVVMGWCEKDPEHAVEWLHSVSKTIPPPYPTKEWGDKSSVAGTCCYHELYKKSPLLALEWCIKNPAQRTRAFESKRLIQQWAEADNLAPRGFIAQIKDPEIRYSLLLAFIEQSKTFKKSDFEGIADWMLEIKLSPFSSEKDNLFPELLFIWIDKDHESAERWIEKTEPINSDEKRVKNEIISILKMNENPYSSHFFKPIKIIDPFVGGARLLKANPESRALPDEGVKRERGDLIQNKIMALGWKDPKAAVLYAVNKQIEGHPEVSFPYDFGTMWYQKSPKEFMEWARTLNKEQFASADACTWFQGKDSDSSEADEYVRTKMARGEKRNRAIFSIATKKFAQNPSEGTSWAESFSVDDDGRVYAIDSVVLSWIQKNPHDAVKWLNSISDTLPSSSEGKRTSISPTLCYLKLYDVSPSDAMDWATKNPNKEIRQSMLSLLLVRWIETDKVSAKDYISKVDNPQVRSELKKVYDFFVNRPNE
jgi:hypothetical protein